MFDKIVKIKTLNCAGANSSVIGELIETLWFGFLTAWLAIIVPSIHLFKLRFCLCGSFCLEVDQLLMNLFECLTLQWFAIGEIQGLK